MNDARSLRIVDEKCDDFEQQLAIGNRPSIPDFCDEVPAELRKTLLAELVRLDVEYRVNLGENPTLSDYLPEFASYRETVAITVDHAITRFVSARANHQLQSAHGLTRGLEVSHFRLEEPIGEGGFGEVWRATDLSLSRLVAIKFPRTQGVDEVALQRFRNEALLAAQLQHANIVRVYEVGHWQGREFIVTDLVDGPTLKELTASGSLSAVAAVSICEKLARALAYAHSKGVIHRDVKPANVLMGPGDEPVLADFGLAKFAVSEASLSREGEVFGTLGYMSPEQASGSNDSVDERTDVYSLGTVLFELLTHRRPFIGPDSSVLQQILEGKPPSVRSFNPHVPAELDSICRRCLSKSPDGRYQSAEELLNAISRARQRLGQVDHASDDTPQLPQRAVSNRNFSWRRLPTALIPCALIALAAYGFRIANTPALGELRIEAPAGLSLRATNLAAPQDTFVFNSETDITLTVGRWKITIEGDAANGLTVSDQGVIEITSSERATVRITQRSARSPDERVASIFFDLAGRRDLPTHHWLKVRVDGREVTVEEAEELPASSRLVDLGFVVEDATQLAALRELTHLESLTLLLPEFTEEYSLASIPMKSLRVFRLLAFSGPREALLALPPSGTLRDLTIGGPISTVLPQLAEKYPLLENLNWSGHDGFPRSRTQQDELSTETAMALLQLPRLQGLSLGRSLVDTEGLRVLSTHPTLESLCLTDCTVTTSGLRYLSKLKELRSLELLDMDTEPDFLKAMQNRFFKKLSICPTDRDAAIEQLTAMHIEEIQLHGAHWTDESLRQIGKIGKVPRLVVTPVMTAITPDCIAEVNKFPGVALSKGGLGPTTASATAQAAAKLLEAGVKIEAVTSQRFLNFEKNSRIPLTTFAEITVLSRKDPRMKLSQVDVTGSEIGVEWLDDVLGSLPYLLERLTVPRGMWSDEQGRLSSLRGKFGEVVVSERPSQ